MKRLFPYIMALILALPISAGLALAADGPVQAGAKALIVYHSKSGHTKALAEEIQRQTGADIFFLDYAEVYPTDREEFSDKVHEEQRQDARPAIKASPDGLEGYGVVYLGFPVWWGDMPMLFYSFLDQNDLSGKQIVPFCTSGSGKIDKAVARIRALEPGATVLDGLRLGETVPVQAVTDWLKGLGLVD
ncbi:MAG: flavodoxin [Deltaproteobacteria bacterium]|nr:flavodoxin [Deltaproteobacteria bacterium]